jgi:hypothetical protein
MQDAYRFLGQRFFLAASSRRFVRLLISAALGDISHSVEFEPFKILDGRSAIVVIDCITVRHNKATIIRLCPPMSREGRSAG